jgi:hypothetical protein
MRPSASGAALVMCGLLGAVGGALAQGGIRTLKGIAVDSTNNKPVAQAAVYVGRTAWGQRTAKDGTFRVTAPTGDVLVTIRRPGFVPALLPVAGDTADAETDVGTARLRPVKSDADRAEMQAADVKAFPELASFYEDRAKYRQGLFFTPDDLQRLGGNLVDLLRQKPNFRFICYQNRKHEVDCGQQPGRGPTSITRSWAGNPASAEMEPCPMEVWTNGGEPFRQTLDNIIVDAILAAEAYPNPGVTPPLYAGSPCAALVLYMKETGR